ncbi:peptide ABC transporter, ATP-binding protein [Liquorilactobacillus ghanensis DSM 18630]|uniref:Peptide ABC transporter, ATP-binding protein n=1 Tax=Liquorilactobacillus ghanensis DSM 18630 TaxID=1423750 RepID=A0A0R1VLH7_9LACO|nr:ABC transporter ATP-binding protein [Liquorilactobacillus ghanensis]KRM06207.1 peptide ABC transporter, ATP-binding protein [Liquorilactobacillus ghanensis DSM 18630]
MLTSPSLIEVKNLSISKERQHQLIINNVNFAIKQGEVFCLVGKSGAGKSMIAKSILRLLPYNLQCSVTGKIIFAGQSLFELSHRQMLKLRGQSIGMIFQDSFGALNPVYKIKVQMADVFHKADPKISKRMIHERSLELLKQVDIEQPEKVLKQYPFELSGGMCQRIMIAITLIQHPRLLIADEPTTSLDVITQKKILNVLLRLNKKLRMSILFITHDLGIVHQIADRIGVIENGHIIEIQECNALFQNPQASYTQKLLANILRVPAMEEEYDTKD